MPVIAQDQEPKRQRRWWIAAALAALLLLTAAASLVAVALLMPLPEVLVVKLDPRGDLNMTGVEIPGAPPSASPPWYAYKRKLRDGATMDVHGIRLGNRLWSLMHRHPPPAETGR